MNIPHHDFWYTTWQVRRTGLLDCVVTNYAKKAQEPFDRWANSSADVRSAPLQRFLDANQPLPEEFLIAFATSRGQVVLLSTNYRIWLRVSKSDSLVHFLVADIKSIETRMRWSSCVVTIKCRNGETTICNEVTHMISDETIGEILDRGTSASNWMALESSVHGKLVTASLSTSEDEHAPLLIREAVPTDSVAVRRAAIFADISRDPKPYAEKHNIVLLSPVLVWLLVWIGICLVLAILGLLNTTLTAACLPLSIAIAVAYTKKANRQRLRKLVEAEMSVSG